MNSRRGFRSFAITLAMVAALLLGAYTPSAALGMVDTSQPTSTVKYVFVHHSTGDAWLQDGYGGLAASMGANNYFVSDTNYGWGPSGIGNSTDVGDWWTWFRGPSAATYTAALYANTQINSSYARSLSDPGGENTVVMFKSCYPNSAVGGSPSDTIPAIGSNPLAGNGMTDLTVGNAKGVYLDLLEYFKLHPDKLFVLIVSPPLREADTNPTHAANARALANWLVDPSGLLSGYSTGNVFVYDYYTVLTGGHHRVVGGAIEHTAGPTNYLAYPTGDSHPSAAGDVAATAEFVPMLNAAYNAWRTGAPPAPAPEVQLPLAIKRSPSTLSLTYKRRRGVARFTLGATLSDTRGRVRGAWVWLQRSSNGKTWRNYIRLKSNSLGMVAKGFSARKKGVTYYRWYAPATATNRAAVTGRQRVRVK